MPTPAWVVIEGWALRDLGAGAALGKAVERIGLPCVVKPSRSGSALGVGFVERQADLPAGRHGRAVVQRRGDRRSEGRGCEVAVGAGRAPLEAAPLVEIVPKSGVYDYAARYTAGATEYFSPARLRGGDVGRVRDGGRGRAEACTCAT